jgi:hypothetical protein
MTENIDEQTRNPYQQFSRANCTLAGDCQTVFPAITTTRTLILHVSCSFGLATGGTIAFASLGSENANPRNGVPVFVNGTSSGMTTYGINADTYLFVNQTDQPSVDVYSPTSVVQDLTCTVSGYSPS